MNYLVAMYNRKYVASEIATQQEVCFTWPDVPFIFNQASARQTVGRMPSNNSRHLLGECLHKDDDGAEP